MRPEREIQSIDDEGDRSHGVQLVLRGLEAYAAPAARMPPHVRRHVDRYFVYQLLWANRHPRLLQLLESCPGVWLLLAGAEDRLRGGVAPLVHETIRDVLAGMRLSAVIDRLVVRWLDVLRPTRDEDRPEGCPDPAARLFGRVNDTALRARYRTFVRRATSGVGPLILADGPPDMLVPEHIPADRGGNVVWYRTTLQARMAYTRAERCDSRVLVGLARFASAHAVELRRECGRRGMWHVFVAAAELCRDEGRQLGYSTNVASLVEELGPRIAVLSMRWGLKQPWGPWSLHTLLPELPDAVDTREGVTATPLRSRRAFLREGREMRNCVGQLRLKPKSRRTRLYGLRLPSSRLTVRFDHTPYGWHLAHLAGEENRPFTGAELVLIHRWLLALSRPDSGTTRETR